MITYILLALRNLAQARRRTLTLATALGMVSMLLVLLLSLSQGVSESMLRSATALVAGHVNVAGFYKAKTTDSIPLVTDATALTKFVSDNVEDIDYIINRGRGWGKIISETGNTQVAMASVDIAAERGLAEQVQLEMESEYKEGGRVETLGSVNGLKEPNSILIFREQAKRLGVTVGDMLTISSETFAGTVNTADVRIVAVAKDIGFLSNWNVFVPTQVLIDLYGQSPDTTGAIQIYLKDPADSTAAMGIIREKLSDAGHRLLDHDPKPFWQKFQQVQGEDWTGQKLDVTTWDDEVSFLKWAISALDGVSIFLCSVLLVMIVIGIINTMTMAVRERTQEIGTLRAIGMRRRQVLGMLMTEAFVLGLLATSAGCFFGAAVGVGLDAAQIPLPSPALRSILLSNTLHLSVKASQLVGTISIFSAVTMLAALSPAARAARLQPVTAIHHVG